MPKVPRLPRMPKIKFNKSHQPQRRENPKYKRRRRIILSEFSSLSAVISGGS
jgi:hypothetical protein